MKIYRARKYTPRRGNSSRRIAAYAVITLVIIFVMGIWGLTLLANLSNFWDSVRGNTLPAVTQDKTPPAAPRLNPQNLYTNNPKITISGSAESATTVTLSNNGTKVDDQLVGNDGQFSFKDVRLKEGSNIFTAQASSNLNLQSTISNQVQVILDTIAPKLTVDQPTDGATATNQYLTVSGKTDPRVTLTVNDQQQVVAADGSFSGVVTLTQAGPVVITVIATDDAGNQTKITRNITYNPS